MSNFSSLYMSGFNAVKKPFDKLEQIAPKFGKVAKWACGMAVAGTVAGALLGGCHGTLEAFWHAQNLSEAINTIRSSVFEQMAEAGLGGAIAGTMIGIAKAKGRG